MIDILKDKVNQKLKGLWITGTSMNQQIVETIERGNHPFFIGVQFHTDYEKATFCHESILPVMNHLRKVVDQLEIHVAKK